MNRQLELILNTLKTFQDKYPTSHVGGSIGLMIRGVDLKRDLYASDLDITIDEFDFKKDSEDLEDRSDNNDFDFSLKKMYDDGHYVKIDIRVTPEPSFDVVEFNGCNYNVSKLRDILFWKNKYSQKGVKKHEDDLITIKTGVRPVELIPELIPDDVLPF